MESKNLAHNRVGLGIDVVARKVRHMFTRYDKFFAALIVAAASFLRAYTGVDIGLDDATAAQLGQLLMAAIVFLVPNKPKAE